jgi:hypothetical protein
MKPTDKCEHGVYLAGQTKAKYCTLCTEPPVITEEERLKIMGKYTPYPHGKNVCPICGFKLAEEFDDYEFKCDNCGFDAMS